MKLGQKQTRQERIDKAFWIMRRRRDHLCYCTACWNEFQNAVGVSAK